MKKKNLAYLLYLTLIGAPAVAVQAEDIDPAVPVEETATLSTGEHKVVQNIASDFEEFAGEDSEKLVEQLRNGEDLSYEVEVEQVVVDENGNPVLVEAVDENGEIIMVPVTDETGEPVLVEALDENGEPIMTPVTDENGEPVMVQVLDDNGEPLLDENGEPVMEQQTEVQMVQATEPLLVEQYETVMETIIVENSNGQMGFGEVSLTLGLAESLLGPGASYADITDVLYGDAGILAMRAEGMGWGEIYQSFDMKVGDVMKDVKSNRVADLDTLNRGQAKRLEKLELASLDKAGKPEKVERVEKAARPDKPERIEKAARPERPERLERLAKPERPEKPTKPERPGRG